MSSDLLIRTTLTLDSSKQHFGPPGAKDYRAHPADNKDENPVVIFKSMVSTGVPPVQDLKQMKSSIYSFKNRKIIVHWLRDVCAAFHLKCTTLCLSIQLTDAFLLNNLNILVGRCQLAAVTCLWIAAKFEEMDGDLPSVCRIVEVCDCAYTAEEVIDMEETILAFFKWRIPHTTLVNHLYLQIHLLSNKALVKLSDEGCCSDAKETIDVAVLRLAATTYMRQWVPASFPHDANTTLKDVLPDLLKLVGVQQTTSIDVYQVFGHGFLLAKRLDLTTVMDQIPRDDRGELRLFPLPTHNQLTSIFVERGGYTILRSLNYDLLDLCDLLIQEVVMHVEFLKLPSFVNALGVLGFALCMLSSPENVEEGKGFVQHIIKALGLSATHSLAAADFLATKYAAAQKMMTPAALEPPVDIRDRLALCFDRPLPSS